MTNGTKNSSSTTAVTRAIATLTPLERKALFWLGLLLTLAPIVRFVLADLVFEHVHEGLAPVLEVTGSLAFIVLGICLMIPPLGMWLISKFPLPSFLKRSDEKQ